LTTLQAAAAAVLVVGCSHQAQAPDPSRVQAVKDALCREAKAAPGGSIVVSGQVLYGDDC
jgi:hypothetical protein